MNVGKSTFKHRMMYDHDVIEGLFGNVRCYDLTNYPQTIMPSKDIKGSLKKEVH